MRMMTLEFRPLSDEQWDDDVKALLAPIAQNGRVLNIFRTLAESFSPSAPLDGLCQSHSG